MFTLFLPLTFSESRRVIVSHGLRVSERLEDRIRLEDLLSDCRLLTANLGQVLQAQLRTLSLAGTWEKEKEGHTRT